MLQEVRHFSEMDDDSGLSEPWSLVLEIPTWVIANTSSCIRKKPAGKTPHWHRIKEAAFKPHGKTAFTTFLPRVVGKLPLDHWIIFHMFKLGLSQFRWLEELLIPRPPLRPYRPWKWMRNLLDGSVGKVTQPPFPFSPEVLRAEKNNRKGTENPKRNPHAVFQASVFSGATLTFSGMCTSSISREWVQIWYKSNRWEIIGAKVAFIRVWRDKTTNILVKLNNCKYLEELIQYRVRYHFSLAISKFSRSWTRTSMSFWVWLSPNRTDVYKSYLQKATVIWWFLAAEIVALKKIQNSEQLHVFREGSFFS